MFIASYDRESFLEVTANAEEGLPHIEVIACVDGEVVCNPSIVLVRTSQALRDLDALLRNWDRPMTLEGSEDFSLTLQPDGKAGDLWVGLRVSRIVYSRSPRTGKLRSGRHLLEGGFSVPGERTTEMLHEMQRLLLPVPERVPAA